MEAIYTAAIVAGSILAFALFWAFVVWLISRLSGWGTLAEQYPERRPWDATCWRMQSARFRGSSNYNGVLKVCADMEGIHVSTIFPFNVGHRPFSVPWYEIEGREQQRFLFREVELRFQRAPKLPMRISPALAARLVQASGGAWRY